MNVASNRSAPAEALSALAKDEDEYVRGYVASNLSTPAEALSALAKDEDEYVRGCASENLAKREQNENLVRQFVRLCL